MERDRSYNQEEYQESDYFNPDVLPPDVKKRYTRYDRLAWISAIPVIEGLAFGGLEFDNDKLLSSLGAIAFVSGLYSFISYIRRRDKIMQEYTPTQQDMKFDKGSKGKFTKPFAVNK